MVLLAKIILFFFLNKVFLLIKQNQSISYDFTLHVVDVMNAGNLFMEKKASLRRKVAQKQCAPASSTKPGHNNLNAK